MNLYFYVSEFPSNGHGAAKAAHGLAAEFIKLGANVTVLCEGKVESVERGEDGIEIHRFAYPTSHYPFTLPARLRKFVNTLNEDSLFVLSGMFNPRVAGLSFLLRKRRIPYVVAPLDPYHPYVFKQKSYVKLPYWHFIEKSMLKHARAVQVLDRRHEIWLKRLGVHTPVIENVLGFSPAEVPSESALAWRTGEPPRAIFLGRLDTHNKGLDLLIDAFAELKPGSTHLTIQGKDYGEKQSLEAHIRQRGVSEIVRILAPDFHRSSPSIISDYDIFCLASRFEGYSFSSLEAMLAARVLLVSEIAGIAPHVEASGCGVVIKPTVAAIRKGLESLLSRRSEWKTMGMRGRNYALTELQWPKLAAQTWAEYQALILGRMHSAKHRMETSPSEVVR